MCSLLILVFCSTQSEINGLLAHFYISVLFDSVKLKGWGLWVHLKTSEKGQLHCWPHPESFPQKEMTATSTALWSWARLDEPNYKELNLFIGKHCYSTVIRGKRNPTRRKDSRTPRLHANCQDQVEVLTFSYFKT